jgi:hypothetical protein
MIHSVSILQEYVVWWVGAIDTCHVRDSLFIWELKWMWGYKCDVIEIIWICISCGLYSWTHLYSFCLATLEGRTWVLFLFDLRCISLYCDMINHCIHYLFCICLLSLWRQAVVYYLRSFWTLLVKRGDLSVCGHPCVLCISYDSLYAHGGIVVVGSSRGWCGIEIYRLSF